MHFPIKALSRGLYRVFSLVINEHVFQRKKKRNLWNKDNYSSILGGLTEDTNMAAVPLFRDTNMAAETAREKQNRR